MKTEEFDKFQFGEQLGKLEFVREVQHAGV